MGEALEQKEFKVKFYTCIQNTQEYGTNNDHMISKLLFKIDETEYSCIVRQPFGSGKKSIDKDPIEVEIDENLKEKVSFENFREKAEEYFKYCLDSTIKIEGNSSAIMYNNTFKYDFETTVLKSNISGGW